MKKHIKTLVAITACVCLAAALVGCSSSSSGSSSASSTDSSSDSADSSASSSADSSSVATTATGDYASGTQHAVVKVEGYDEFAIELYADDAPNTVANFCDLANSGYYDGLALYRIVEGFCLQGGTLGNTASGNDSTLTPIVGEFSDNGIDNELADNFERGVVAMARTSDMDSATSTFFITLSTSSSVSQSLDGQYAAFGTIDEAGMAIVDAIVADHADAEMDSMGVIASEADMPIIESITITD